MNTDHSSVSIPPSLPLEPSPSLASSEQPNSSTRYFPNAFFYKIGIDYNSSIPMARRRFAVMIVMTVYLIVVVSAISCLNYSVLSNSINWTVATLVIVTLLLVLELMFGNRRSCIFSWALSGILIRIWTSYSIPVIKLDQLKIYEFVLTSFGVTIANNDTHHVETGITTNSQQIHDVTFNGELAFIYMEIVYGSILCVIVTLSYVCFIKKRAYLIRLLFLGTLACISVSMCFRPFVPTGNDMNIASTISIFLCTIVEIHYISENVLSSATKPTDTIRENHIYIFLIRTLWPMAFVTSTVVLWMLPVALLLNYTSYSNNVIKYRETQSDVQTVTANGELRQPTKPGTFNAVRAHQPPEDVVDGDNS